MRYRICILLKWVDGRFTLQLAFSRNLVVLKIELYCLFLYFCLIPEGERGFHPNFPHKISRYCLYAALVNISSTTKPLTYDISTSHIGLLFVDVVVFCFCLQINLCVLVRVTLVVVKAVKFQAEKDSSEKAMQVK